MSEYDNNDCNSHQTGSQNSPGNQKQPTLTEFSPVPQQIKPRAGYVLGLAIAGLILTTNFSPLVGIIFCILGFTKANQDFKRDLKSTELFFTQAGSCLATIGFFLAALKIVAIILENLLSRSLSL